MYIQVVLAFFMSKYRVIAEPLLHLALLATFIGFPIASIPQVFVWTFDKLLYVVWPFCLVLEAVSITAICVSAGRLAADKVEEYPVISKASILSLSAACYAVAAQFGWIIWNSAANNQFVFLTLITLLVVTHVLCIQKQEGVISDAALLSVISILYMYSVVCECPSGHHTPAPLLTTVDRGTSCLNLLINLMLSGYGKSTDAWVFLSSLVTPTFISSTLLRVGTILYAGELLRKYLNQNNDEDDYGVDCCTISEETSSATCWNSPLVVRLVVYFVYTQTIVDHVDLRQSEPMAVTRLLPNEAFFQVPIMFASYWWHLYTSEIS